MAGSDKITPAGEKLLKNLNKMKKLQVRVGVQGGKKYKKKSRDGKEDGADLVDIAIWNELGTGRIPARPFFAQTVQMHEEEIKEMAATEVSQALLGEKDSQQAFEVIGEDVRKKVQNRIDEGQFVPNAPSTIKRKGHDHPLIDTRTMRDSISYTVCEKGEYD